MNLVLVETFALHSKNQAMSFRDCSIEPRSREEKENYFELNGSEELRISQDEAIYVSETFEPNDIAESVSKEANGNGCFDNWSMKKCQKYKNREKSCNMIDWTGGLPWQYNCRLTCQRCRIADLDDNRFVKKEYLFFPVLSKS